MLYIVAPRKERATDQVGACWKYTDKETLLLFIWNKCASSIKKMLGSPGLNTVGNELERFMYLKLYKL